MKSHSVNEIARAMSAVVAGDGDIRISSASEPDKARADQLAIAMDKRFAEGLSRGSARAAVLWRNADWQSYGLEAAILVARPRLAMAALTSHLKDTAAPPAGVHPTAVIDPGAELAPDVSIGAFVVIGAGVVVGARACIGAHTSIGPGSRIGAGAQIQEGVRIGPAVTIGKRFVAHPGVVIGSDGFSFTPTGEAENDGGWAKIHSLGGVTIGDDIQIGANSNVDAGTIRATSIGDGTKIDALVHIAHNVQIGANCLLCGQVGIAGSARLGDNVILAGHCAVHDNITIGDGVIAGGASKIMSNVAPGRKLLGYPATDLDAQIASYKAFRRLPKLARKLAELQKRVAEIARKGA
ncbi:MAG: UDP-3-O-(3-hydroxymyristoyl)glucosamine N-acyltransferase [Paracoccaceae bacterium]